MNNLDTLVNKVMEHRAKTLASKTGLVVLIEPVSRCNLACRYCAADGWKQNEKLRIIPKETLDDYLTKVADFIVRYNTAAYIAMHGYEPLQAGIETYVYVQDKVNELGIRDRVRLITQTNGVLMNDEWAEFFVKNDWRVGFSIDGPREYHDAMRVFQNGKGSYDLAMRGVKIYMEKSRSPVGIISTITSAYRKPSLDESVKIYYNWLLENNIGSTLLHIASVDPRNPFSKMIAMTDEEYAKWFITLYHIWANRNDGLRVSPFDHIIETMIKGSAPYKLCYLRNGCWRVVGINADGIIHLCDRYSYIGKHISEYKTLDDFLFKDPEMRKQALRPYMLRMYDNECSKCRYFKICQGGCTNEAIYNYYATGQAIFGVPQWTRTQHCTFYKALLSEIEKDLRSRGIELALAR